MAKLMTLRLRGTFIDVEDDGAEMPCRRPRSLSESCLRVDSTEDWAGFGHEQAYVQSLSQKLASLNCDIRCAMLFFEGNCKVEPEVLCKCSGGADNLSVASTSTPTAGGADMISDSSSQAAVLPETVDTAMQLAQGMIQIVGQSLFVAADGAQQLPLGAGIPNAINNSVANMIMQVKADALEADAFGVDSARVGMNWAESSADSPDLVAPMFESPSCSRGSVGHPELCSKPCLYFAMGSCDSGESCEYCHLAHPKRPAHLDKRHREMLRSMAPSEWAALVMPILQKKIEALDDSLETRAMFADIAQAFLYFAMGSCGSGESCEYCHLAHPKRPAHLDKRHREMLRSMAPREWAALVLPILQSKISALDDSLETRAMFADIASGSGIPIGSVVSSTPQRSHRMLILSLRSMSLKSLLTAALRGLSEHGQGVDEAVDVLLQHLRKLSGQGAEPIAQRSPQL
eukprot:CAMPEP_0204248526 /NCGR_PEP_ID=MMETSP0361-20130328/99209_1 /ASSEMBLY_ACC=CAM_ASM_000343 /TAXON_ID=268821 /ORGANISM="Scrippsiella Hangoei, Strain SHTV-5" /LENGTH=458 /DNA_ID=CAMNT_0051221793 /DNA_START=111 /DNA_END=1488 /DNA_ORIENTATION=-